jgi:hypothetical protein
MRNSGPAAGLSSLSLFRRAASKSHQDWEKAVAMAAKVEHDAGAVDPKSLHGHVDTYYDCERLSRWGRGWQQLGWEAGSAGSGLWNSVLSLPTPLEQRPVPPHPLGTASCPSPPPWNSVLSLPTSFCPHPDVTPCSAATFTSLFRTATGSTTWNKW